MGKVTGVGMKTHKRYLFLVIAVLSLFLSGCGTAMYELTAEEEELIVQSAANFVAKHNIQQKDGISGLYVTDEMLEPESETPIETESEIVSETESEAAGDGSSGSGEQNTVEDGVSLASVLGYGSDLQIVYKGSTLSKQFSEGTAGSVDAMDGCTFYVMKFSITNVSKDTVKMNNITQKLEFKLTSGSLNVKAEKTILSEDLSTYVGEIPAGKTVEAILLFEVSEANAQGITTPTLQITIDNETKKVKL